MFDYYVRTKIVDVSYKFIAIEYFGIFYSNLFCVIREVQNGIEVIIHLFAVYILDGLQYL